MIRIFARGLLSPRRDFACLSFTSPAELSGSSKTLKHPAQSRRGLHQVGSEKQADHGYRDYQFKNILFDQISGCRDPRQHE